MEKRADDKAEELATRTSNDDTLDASSIRGSSTPVKLPNAEGDAVAKTNTQGTDSDWEYVTGWKLAMVMLTTALVAFLMLLDTAIIATAIPKITTDFHSLGDVGWYGSSYLLSSSAIQPLTGKIYTHFSSKYTFMTFVGIFELGSLLCGLSNSSKMLIVGRAVAGLGGAGLMNGALTIISACVPLVKRPVYMGFLMSFGQMGILFGPLLGGAFTQYTTWRWCFYINLPIGGVALAFLALIHIPDRTVKPEIRPTWSSYFKLLDIIGFLLFAPTAIMFFLALEWGGTVYAWNSAVVIGLFCGSAGNLVVFLVWEHRQGDDAMIPLNMLKKRIVWSSCLTMFFVFGSMMITSYYLAIYFQSIRGKKPMLSGVYLLPIIISNMVFAIISGLLVSRVGYYLPFSIASGIINSISVGLFGTFSPTTSNAYWIGIQILGGVGRGLGMQMPMVAVQNVLPQNQIAVSMALLIFFQTFGGALWLSLASTTFNSGLKGALIKYAPEVNAEMVLKAGATGFRALVLPQGSIDGLIKAFSVAVNQVFYLGAGAAVASFVFSMGLGWKSIKKAKKVEASESDA